MSSKKRKNFPAPWDRIDKLRQGKGLAWDGLDRLAGLDDYCGRSARAGSMPSGDRLAAIADALGVPLSDLMPGSKPPELERIPLNWVRVPLYDVPGGPPVMTEAGEEEVFYVMKHLGGVGRFALRVRGDSMAPSIVTGDIVLIEPWQGSRIERLDNDICAVLLDGESTLKRVQIQKAGKSQVVILKGNSPASETETFVLGKRRFKVQGVLVALVYRTFS